MLLILEGLENVGKTTVAAAIERELGVPVYRPFRTDRREHTGEGGALADMLKRFAVPYNTHVEDLYTADLLATLQHSSVVLDRSLPSGIAYGLARDVLKGDVAKEMFGWWKRRLEARADVLYVYMVCDIGVAQARAARVQHSPVGLGILQDTLDYCWSQMKAPFRRLLVNTTRLKPEVVQAIVLEAAEKEIR